MIRVGTYHMLGALALTLMVMMPVPTVAGQIGRLGPDRPDESGFSSVREVFDCVYRDTLNTAELDTLQGDTTGSESRISGYACRAWTETGPEHVFRLEVPTRVVFSARLTDLVGDLDLVLLSACDTEACLVQENTGFSLDLEPGSYVLIVDGYQGASGSYTVVMTARAPGVPPQVCAEGGAEPVAPPDAGLSLEGDLFGRDDLIQAYAPCSDLWHLAGEAWYAVTLPPVGLDGLRRVTLTTTATAASLDLAIWVFDGCGESARCLDFADDAVGGGPETVVLVNEDENPRVVYLAVDAFRPPVDEDAGGFTVQIDVAVPTERSSLGGMRAGFY